MYFFIYRNRLHYSSRKPDVYNINADYIMLISFIVINAYNHRKLHIQQIKTSRKKSKISQIFIKYLKLS
jgi:hypothetical protein